MKSIIIITLKAENASLLHSVGSIGGLSVRVGGVVLGIDGTKPCTESGSVFCVMLEIVVGRE